MKIKELLSDESKWTKSCMSRDINGNPLVYPSIDACSFCLVGALLKCYKGMDYEVIKIQIKQFLNIENLASWNDAPERTFAEVKELVERLDI